MNIIKLGSDKMYLIVGLGNPGREYQNTRHNIGFRYLDFFCEEHQIEMYRSKMNGIYGETMLQGEKVILLKPQSYMNLSGTVVQRFVQFYKIPLDHILVIQDDLDMPTGKIKLKKGSSSGGHNGIQNIIDQLGTKEFKRLKIGISNNKQISTADYVLGKFSKDEEEILKNIAPKVNDILEDFIQLPFDQLMNRYNQK